MKPQVRVSKLRAAFTVAFNAHAGQKRTRLLRQVGHALRGNKGRIYSNGRFSVKRGAKA